MSHDPTGLWLFLLPTSNSVVIINLPLMQKIPMQRKIFKFKVISKEGYCTLSLDYTNLTNEIIRPITASLIKIEPNEKCKLLFVGKEDCRLTLEDVYNLTSLFQSVIGSALVWDIIGDYLHTDDSQELDGYLIINPDIINQ